MSQMSHSNTKLIGNHQSAPPRLIVVILSEIVRDYGGAIRRSDFYKMFAAHRVSTRRRDMNYGSWVSLDASRHLQNMQDDTEDPTLTVTAVGKALLMGNGVDVAALEDAYAMDYAQAENEWWKHESGGESWDERMARLHASRKADEW